jgi:tetratricopeptide (TPR) repeat protein
MSRLLALLIALSLAATAPSLFAGNDDTKAARPYAAHGLSLFQEGRYREAIDQFEKAESHYHAPTHLLYIARAHEALGELVEAHAMYRRIVDEDLDENAPKAFERAQVEAVTEVGKLEPRIPVVEVAVRGADPSAVTLSVNGTPRDVGRLLLNPGTHTIAAEASGFESAPEVVTLSEGDRRELTLTMSPTEPERVSLFVPAMISFAVSGTTLVVGIATGAASLDEVDEIHESCVGNDCPRELQGDADTAKALGRTSTAMFVIAGLAAAAGATLLAIDVMGDDGEMALRLGPGALALEGRF